MGYMNGDDGLFVQKIREKNKESKKAEKMEIYEKYLTTDEKDKIKLKIPEYFNYGFDIIDEHAKRTPEKIALTWANETDEIIFKYNFGVISSLSNAFGNVLKEYNIERGDFALLMLPRIPDWYITMLGMIKTGVVPIPSVTMLTSKDLEYRINKIQAKAVITNNENIPKIKEIKKFCPSLKEIISVGRDADGYEDCQYVADMHTASHNLEPIDTKSDDWLVGYFTSGTTGKPKVVLHKQSYALAHIVTSKFWGDLRPTDIHWATSDTGWAKSAWGFFGPWIIGATIFMHDQQRFEPKKFLQILQDHKITNLCSVPTIYRALVEESFLKDLRQYDFNNLRYCTSVGEPLNSGTIKVWEKETGLLIKDGYGQTESVLIVGNQPGTPVKLGSMGKASPIFDVCIVNENGKELPTREVGEIAIKVKPNHPGLFDGYYKDDEKTQEVFKGNWYFTGDSATRDEEGYIWFMSRDDDIITSAGYRIGPFEVEDALVSHPAVVEAAAIGAPDPDRYEKVKAFIVLTSEHKGSEKLVRELQKHVKKITAPYKYPREIEFVEKLPKTISGKILRKDLKKQEYEKYENMKNQKIE